MSVLIKGMEIPKSCLHGADYAKAIQWTDFVTR